MSGSYGFRQTVIYHGKGLYGLSFLNGNPIGDLMAAQNDDDAINGFATMIPETPGIKREDFGKYHEIDSQ